MVEKLGAARPVGKVCVRVEKREENSAWDVGPVFAQDAAGAGERRQYCVRSDGRLVDTTLRSKP